MTRLLAAIAVLYMAMACTSSTPQGRMEPEVSTEETLDQHLESLSTRFPGDPRNYSNAAFDPGPMFQCPTPRVHGQIVRRSQDCLAILLDTRPLSYDPAGMSMSAYRDKQYLGELMILERYQQYLLARISFPVPGQPIKLGDHVAVFP